MSTPIELSKTIHSHVEQPLESTIVQLNGQKREIEQIKVDDPAGCDKKQPLKGKLGIKEVALRVAVTIAFIIIELIMISGFLMTATSPFPAFGVPVILVGGMMSLFGIFLTWFPPEGTKPLSESIREH